MPYLPFRQVRFYIRLRFKMAEYLKNKHQKLLRHIAIIF